MRRLFVFGLTATLALLPRAAAANWTLSWRAPSSCPAEQQVREAVRKMLPDDDRMLEAAGIEVSSVVHKVSEGFALELSLVSASGRAREELVALRCETLAGVVALKVVLAADPGAWFAAFEPREDGRLALRIGISAGPGVLPGWGPLLDLTGRLKLGWASIELGAGYGLRNDASHPAHPELGAALDLFLSSARFCVLPRAGPFELPLCAGPDLGLMRGHGFGVQDPRTWAEPWVAAAAGPGLRWTVRHQLAIVVGIAAFVALARPSYRVLDLTPDRIYTPARVGARIHLGLELQIE